jgi:hypothetical protein
MFLFSPQKRIRGLVASFLKGFDEYWRANADTCQKLVAPHEKPKAVILKYEPKKAIDTPTEKNTSATSELIHERSCILASDMNLPFEWAEAVVKLRSIERPQMIPQTSWLEIKATCTQLYIDDFALLKLIINNDWLLEDIYGCNKVAPLVRVDCMGLLLLLHQGDEVVGVNKERIKILRRSGKVNYLYRRLDRQMKIDLLYEL